MASSKVSTPEQIAAEAIAAGPEKAREALTMFKRLVAEATPAVEMLERFLADQNEGK